jgi:hypothetical protein
MERNRFLTLALLFLMAFAVTSTTTATAQELLRLDGEGDAWSIDGEPTDLEGVLTIVGENTLEENDIGTTVPVDQGDYDSWLDRLLGLLIDLGLMAP